MRDALKIELNHIDGAYYAGEHVQGCIIVGQNESRIVKVSLCAKALVQFKLRDKRYSEDQKLIEKTNELEPEGFFCEKTRKRLVRSVFDFRIPVNAPGSADLAFGKSDPVSSIEYFIKAVCADSGRETVLPIKILPNRPAPLPILLVPRTTSIEQVEQADAGAKKRRFWPRLRAGGNAAPGGIKVALSVPRRAFGSNDYINTRGSYAVNNTGEPVRVDLSIRCYKQMTGVVDDRSNTKARTKLSFKDRTLLTASLKPGQRLEIAGYHAVPGLAPSWRHDDACLRWTYALQLIVEGMPSKSDPTPNSVKVRMPILICSAPPIVPEAPLHVDEDKYPDDLKTSDPWSVMKYCSFRKKPCPTIPILETPKAPIEEDPDAISPDQYAQEEEEDIVRSDDAHRDLSSSDGSGNSNDDELSENIERIDDFEEHDNITEPPDEAEDCPEPCPTTDAEEPGSNNEEVHSESGENEHPPNAKDAPRGAYDLDFDDESIWFDNDEPLDDDTDHRLRVSRAFLERSTHSSKEHNSSFSNSADSLDANHSFSGDTSAPDIVKEDLAEPSKEGACMLQVTKDSSESPDTVKENDEVHGNEVGTGEDETAQLSSDGSNSVDEQDEESRVSSLISPGPDDDKGTQEEVNKELSLQELQKLKDENERLRSENDSLRASFEIKSPKAEFNHAHVDEKNTNKNIIEEEEEKELAKEDVKDDRDNGKSTTEITPKATVSTSPKHDQIRSLAEKMLSLAEKAIDQRRDSTSKRPSLFTEEVLAELNEVSDNDPGEDDDEADYEEEEIVEEEDFIEQEVVEEIIEEEMVEEEIVEEENVEEEIVEEVIECELPAEDASKITDTNNDCNICQEPVNSTSAQVHIDGQYDTDQKAMPSTSEPVEPNASTDLLAKGTGQADASEAEDKPGSTTNQPVKEDERDELFNQNDKLDCSAELPVKEGDGQAVSPAQEDSVCISETKPVASSDISGHLNNIENKGVVDVAYGEDDLAGVVHGKSNEAPNPVVAASSVVDPPGNSGEHTVSILPVKHKRPQHSLDDSMDLEVLKMRESSALSSAVSVHSSKKGESTQNSLDFHSTSSSMHSASRSEASEEEGSESHSKPSLADILHCCSHSDLSADPDKEETKVKKKKTKKKKASDDDVSVEGVAKAKKTKKISRKSVSKSKSSGLEALLARKNSDSDDESVRKAPKKAKSADLEKMMARYNDSSDEEGPSVDGKSEAPVKKKKKKRSDSLRKIEKPKKKAEPERVHISIEARNLGAVDAFRRSPSSPLSDDELLKLDSIVTAVTFQPGEVILEGNDTEREAVIYFLKRGQAETLQKSRYSLLFLPGMHFGEELFTSAREKKQTTGISHDKVTAQKVCVCGMIRIRDYFEAFGDKYTDTVTK